MADLIAVIEMIDEVVIEVDGLLHKPKAEGTGAEVEILLCVIHGGGDVMEAENW